MIANYPTTTTTAYDSHTNHDMQVLLDVVHGSRSARQQMNIPVRQSMQSIYITSSDPLNLSLIKQHSDQLKFLCSSREIITTNECTNTDNNQYYPISSSVSIGISLTNDVTGKVASNSNSNNSNMNNELLRKKLCKLNEHLGKLESTLDNPSVPEKVKEQKR